MSEPPPTTVRELAAATRRMARRTGERTPSVRGSDWRLAVVATVNTDGTVITSDGITARRMETYAMPLVGDLIRVSQSSTGNWIALGRTDSGSGTPWQPYTPAWTASTTNPTLGNGTLAGRYCLLPNRTCIAVIRLVIGSTTSIGSGTYLFTVPFLSANDGVEFVGKARFSAASTYIGQCFLGINTTTMNATFPATATPATAANMSTTNPAAPASGNTLRLQIEYQTAA
ncbi:hypothetical protein [Streptomyces antibioticus]|uniref:hypothetical protein n=1 Tax=Streptomyces antibioticus TaxID=1890 RepID=UPI00370299AD